MSVLRLLTRRRELADVPAASDSEDAASLHRISVAFWAPPAASELRLPPVETCADIPWAMMHIDTWPDGDAKFEAEAYLNRRWRELRCCDHPVPFSCDQIPYPDVPSQIEWSA